MSGLNLRLNFIRVYYIKKKKKERNKERERKSKKKKNKENGEDSEKLKRENLLFWFV